MYMYDICQLAYFQYSLVNRSVQRLTECIETCPSTRPHGDLPSTNQPADLVQLELCVGGELSPGHLEEDLDQLVAGNLVLGEGVLFQIVVEILRERGREGEG